MPKQSHILITEPGADYELIDSGEGEKLERFGKYVLSRPDPQALWHKHLPVAEWKKADGFFTRDDKKGDWSFQKGMPDRWPIQFGGLKFLIRPSAFKHTGLFPEQSVNWDWLRKMIADAGKRNISGNASPAASATEPQVEVLNLFGYTGGATLACAEAGAKVVHVDSSKAALTWARENAELSGLKDKPIRWILDDARDFVRREVKRGRTYSGIIMDPPAFGHGPENEVWKIEEHFISLVDECMKLLGDAPLFFLINGYSAGYSAVAYENILMPLLQHHDGSIEIGELAIREKRNEAKDIEEGRLLPCGIFARWSAQ